MTDAAARIPINGDGTARARAGRFPAGEAVDAGPPVEARGLHRTYRGVAGPELHVLRGVDLALDWGEAVAIVGASGSGKSTLLHLLGALDRPSAGSVHIGGTDVANLQVTADRDGEEYVINGSKMFITNGRHGDTFLLLARTDREVEPRHRGISAFIAEKGDAGFKVGRDLDKLGYRGLDTCELIFDDYRVPADNLVGMEENRGFAQVMSGLETGRINVAARAVGVAQAAFEAAIRYSQQRETFGAPISQHQAIQLKLADMATKIQAARLLTYDAATKKDSGQRVDLETGMAKLFASEICGEVTMEAMRIHGGYGYIKESPVERYYRDAPLMIIGEGTNEILRLVIARQLLRRPEYQV